MSARPIAMFKIALSWLMVLACMGFIFRVSATPGSDIPPLFPYQDVVYHFVIYLILGVLFSHALKNTYPKLNRRQAVIIACLFTLIYGASDEVHQFFVPGRSCTLADMFIDGLCGSLGAILLR